MTTSTITTMSHLNETIAYFGLDVTFFKKIDEEGTFTLYYLIDESYFKWYEIKKYFNCRKAKKDFKKYLRLKSSFAICYIELKYAD